MQISGLQASGTFAASDVLAIEINGKTYKLTGGTLASALQTIGGFLTGEDVVNSLTNGGTTVPLSAEMGKTLNGLIKNATSVTIQGGGNFGITIIRLGYIRIVYMYNGVDLQTPISVQLGAKDIPAYDVNVGSWVAISNSAYGSRYIAINQSGILSTSGDVYRGGWNFIYVASSPA